MKEFKVQPIRNGTVIDHIDAGQAIKVLRILGLPASGARSIISVGMNLPSRKTGNKDVVKVEDRELDPLEVSKISLIAPRATINIIRNFEVHEKTVVQIPDEVVGVAHCENVNCVTNTSEPVRSRFAVQSKQPLALACAYCGRVVQDVAASLLRNGA